MAEWRAVFCQSQREAVALGSLQGLGLPCWYPYRLVKRYRPGRKSMHLRVPYFPGYLFSDVEKAALSLPALARVEGVEALLGEASIPSEIMGKLMALADPDGRMTDPPPKPGDAFPTGLPGLVGELVRLDSSAATVLIPIFGTMMPATISVSRLLG